MSWFSFLTGTGGESTELPDIYPFPVVEQAFRDSDILGTYQKILTDTLERVHGLSEKQMKVMWDSCLQSESNRGLIQLLSEAMACQQELFLVYKASLDILRKADRDEEKQIRDDYKKTGKSNVGIFVSFKDYKRSELLKVYSALEFCVLCSMHKSLNLSKAVQLKISDLRASVSLSDSAIAKSQAMDMARALARGKDILLDAKDVVETAKPDTSTMEKAIAFLDSKRAYILGFPIAYIAGQQAPGIGDTGEADTKLIERGLKQYFESILKPVATALFGGVKLEFRSQDFREMSTALEVAKTFELVSDQTIPPEVKIEILAKVFGIEQKDYEDALAKVEVITPPATAPQPPAQQPPQQGNT